MARIPLIETSVFRRIAPPVLVESVGPTGIKTNLVTATGVFQNWKDLNENHRRYPEQLWRDRLAENSPFMQKVKARGVLGVLEHPGDGVTNIRSVSHVITEVHMRTPS